MAINWRLKVRQSKEMSAFCFLAQLLYLADDYGDGWVRVVEHAAGLRVKLPRRLLQFSNLRLNFDWSKNATKAMLWQKFKLPKFKKYAVGRHLANAKFVLTWVTSNVEIREKAQRRARNNG